MSNLTDLVPPLELCKKIPAGEFEDAAFQWQESKLKDGSRGVDLIQHYPGEWANPEWAGENEQQIQVPGVGQGK